MLKIRYISDVHNEFGYLDLPKLDSDSETVLVLAGDIGVAYNMDTILPIVEEVSPRFLKVIYVLGNHEFYNSSILTTFNKIKTALAHLTNVTVVENETVVVGDVAFVCATLWSDFNGQNPICMDQASRAMNDFHIIHTGPNADDAYSWTLAPLDVYKLYVESHDYIFSAISHEHNIGHTPVVVTHHAPSFLSIDEKYKGNLLNGAFATELGNEIVAAGPKLWIHGHVHDSFNYMMGDTRIVCNPRGYPHELNLNFDPCAIIDL